MSRKSKVERIGDTHKSCTACGQMKPMGDYYVKPNGPKVNGERRKMPTSWCKPCYIEKQLAYYHKKKSENA